MTRILLLSNCRPAPGDGGGERTLSIYNALTRLGHVDVLIVPPANRPIFDNTSEYVANLLDDPRRATPWYWRKQLYLFRDFRPNARIAGKVRELHRWHPYDAFFGRYHLPFLGDTTNLGPSFVDIDDVPADTWTSRIPLIDLIRQKLLVYAMRGFITVFVTKPADVRKLVHDDVRVLPCISTRPYATGPITYQGSDKRMLFIGGKWHTPNNDGISRFMRNCLPKIREQVPDAFLRLIGSGRKVLDGTDGISAEDFVDDLVDEYRRATIFVCPIYRGAGSLIKLAEAAEYGLAIVTTQFAARGFEGILRPGRDMLVAESDEEFAHYCVALLLNRQQRDTLGNNAKAAAAANLQQANIDKIIANAVEPCLAKGRSVGIV
jgi:glycosyltransferase involved in cell wall biosynthesis